MQKQKTRAWALSCSTNSLQIKWVFSPVLFFSVLKMYLVILGTCAYDSTENIFKSPKKNQNMKREEYQIKETHL